MLLICSRILVAFIIIITACQAAPYSWLSNEVGYDASLDPVMWSRAFAKDTIRKPRYMQAFTKLRNLVGDERNAEDLNRLMSRSTGQRYEQISAGSHSQRSGFGKRGRQISNSWFDKVPAVVQQKPSFKKSLYRRKQRKLNTRGRYGFY